MIDHCPKCQSEALIPIEAATGEHKYLCIGCEHVTKTIEVPEEHLRNLTLDALVSFTKLPAAGPDVGDGDNMP